MRPCVQDAAVVAQLRACGAVLAGKTNMHELGAGTSGINPHHGYASLVVVLFIIRAVSKSQFFYPFTNGFLTWFDGFRSTRNPYNTGKVAGGSSGGSAAVVCAGLCPVALGADGGGKPTQLVHANWEFF
jgi:Asp-tRNA(Asn)/Glu-tRNA(Gln) amidotransferase A subunit family amidase